MITRSALTKISEMGAGYALTFQTGVKTNVVEADEVILTLPFGVLRGIDFSSAGFDSLKKVAINELGYGTNTKLVLQFAQRYWNTGGPWGIGDGNVYTDLFFQNTWDSSRGIGDPGRKTGVLTGYMGGSNGASFTAAASPYASAENDPSVAEYAKAFLAQLEVSGPASLNTGTAGRP